MSQTAVAQQVSRAGQSSVRYVFTLTHHWMDVRDLASKSLEEVRQMAEDGEERYISLEDYRKQVQGWSKEHRDDEKVIGYGQIDNFTAIGVHFLGSQQDGPTIFAFAYLIPDS